MNKWRPSCMILKRLNVINVNSDYYVKRVNFLICSRFIHYKDVFKNYDLRFSDVKKPRFWRQNSISYIWMVSILNETSKPPVNIFSNILTHMIHKWLQFTLTMEKSNKLNLSKGSLTLAMGKCLWFSVKIKVCQSSLSSPWSYPDLSTLWLWNLFSILNALKI